MDDAALTARPAAYAACDYAGHADKVAAVARETELDPRGVARAGAGR